MGWSVSFIVVNEREDGYLGTFPAHRSDEAQRLAVRLFPGRRYEPKGRTDLDRALCPQHPAIGAYDGAAIVAHREGTVGAVVNGDDDPLVAALVGIYPAAAMMSVQLQSAVDLFAFAYFERGTLIRSCAGTSIEGVLDERGDPLSEERAFLPALAGAPRTDAHGDLDAGEELVFAVSRRFFGTPLNALPLWDLALEEFVPARPRLIA